MKQRDAYFLVALLGASASMMAVSTGRSDSSREAEESVEDVRMVGLGGARAAGKCPFYGIYSNSETLALYTPDMLNLEPGEVIKALYVEGYVSETGAIVGTESNLRLGYAWVDDATLEKPETGAAAYDCSSINIVYDDTMLWEAKGTSSQYVHVVEMNFDTPIIYEEGKSLLLYFHNERDAALGGLYFDNNSSNPKNAWTQYADNQDADKNPTAPGNFTGNWEAYPVPPIHLVMGKADAHNWNITSVSIPETATQNQDAAGTLKLVNSDKEDVLAGSYSVTTYIDDFAVETQGAVDLKASTEGETKEIEIPFSFRSPRPGKAAVKVVLTAEDGYSVETEPVDVEFEKETLNVVNMAGQGGGRQRGYAPIYGSYAHSETLALYTPEMLNLQAGEAIKALYFEGYIGGDMADSESKFRVGYAWDDRTELVAPESANTSFDLSGITMVFDETVKWEAKGSSSSLVPVVRVDFETPIVYEEGKSLLMYFYNERAEKKTGIYFDHSDKNPKNAWSRAGNEPGVYTNNKNYANKEFDEYLWENFNLNPVHLVMDVNPNSVSGKVNVKGVGVKDAVVTLISNDGDNIQYEGVSDAEGNYKVDVIQSERVYDMEVHSADFAEYDENLDLSAASIVKNIDLRRVVKISDNGAHIGGDENAIVYFDKKLAPGYNVIALPLALTADEVAEIFGEEAKVYDFDKDAEIDGKVVVNFKDHEGALEAGRPYLIYVESETKEMEWTSREAAETLDDVEGTNLSLKTTSAPTELTEDMIAMNESLIQEEEEKPEAEKVQAREGEANILPAYSGYFALKGDKKDMAVLLNSSLIESGIESIVKDENDVHQIYDLNGYKVANPSKGLYVIDGKLILVK